MKKKYLTAEVEIDFFEENDIICESITDGDGDHDGEETGEDDDF